MPPCADGECEPCVSDDDLFKQPQREECPICMLPLPMDFRQQKYQSCCGKIICDGCIYANQTENNCTICAFCRAPEASSEGECLQRLKKRVEACDAGAICQLGFYYHRGENGLRKNRKKANKLFLRAGELGCVTANHNIGINYFNGFGVERDETKAKYYWELAAMGGNVKARHNLGILEDKIAGNTSRALKHWMIAAAAGYDKSLEGIRKAFMEGHAAKDDFETALRAHKEASDEMRREQREAAAACLGRN